MSSDVQETADLEPGSRPRRPWPISVLLWTVGIGLGSGLLELGVFLLKCHYLDPRNYNVSRHYPWMFPLAGLTVVVVPGLLLALAALIWPRRIASEVVIGVLTFPAYLGFLFRWPIATLACLILSTGLALQTARMLAKHVRWFDRWLVRGLAGVATLLAVSAMADLGPSAWAKPRSLITNGDRSKKAKNVVLIVLDTVRAGSLSLYGYDRETTPNLARWAARGVRFDRAYSTAPWTAPSHASMFTGKWSRQLSVGWNRPLDGTSPTLAEFLGERGYATAGFVANTTYCSYETGLDRGFAHYEDYDVTPGAVLLCSSVVQRTLNFLYTHPSLARRLGQTESIGSPRKTASRINKDFLNWLDRQDDRPFFAFLNFFDVHHPYFPPEPIEGLPFGGKPESFDDYWMLKTWWDYDKLRLDPRDVAVARDAYDHCIAYLDREIGRLFEDFERRGILENTLIIVTSDHGEHLGERQLFGHGCSVYLPELHVPLLVIEPGGIAGGSVVKEPVSLRNLAATVVDRLDLGEESPFPGRSLAQTWAPGEKDVRLPFEPLLSEIDAPFEADPNHGRSPVCRGPLTSLVDRNFHYIHNGDGREELYHLESDPAESRNLANSAESLSILDRFRSHLKR